MFSRAGAIRFVVCVSLFCLFASSASAVPWVRIYSPADGTEYDPGTNFNATVSFGNSVAGVQRLTVTLDGEGWSYSWGTFPAKRSGTQIVPLTVPAGASPGQSMTLLATLTDYVDGTFQTSITIRTPAPDTEAPTYAGDEGIISAVRTNGNQSAYLTWNQAQDNVTAANNIVYNIYYSDNPGLLVRSVGASPPQTTFTGQTTGTVSGLDTAKDYIFIVTAEDEAGNEEFNLAFAQGRVPATPGFGSVTELFEGSRTFLPVLDAAGAYAETIQASLDGGFRWGAYAVGASELDDQIALYAVIDPEPTHLAFEDATRAAGSYAHTRFDNTTIPYLTPLGHPLPPPGPLG